MNTSNHINNGDKSVNCLSKDFYYRIEGFEINRKYKESSNLQIDQLNEEDLSP